MNCTEFEHRLHECVEERLSAGKEMHDHSAECHRCSVLWNEHLLLAQIVPVWRQETPDVDLVHAVLERFHATTQPSVIEQAPRESAAKVVSGLPHHGMPAASRSPRHATLAVTVAAALLVVLTLEPLGLVPGRSNSQSELSLTAKQKPVDANPLEITRPPALDEILRQAGSSYLQLAEGAGAAVTDAVDIVPAADQLFLSLQFQPPQLPAATRSIGEWGRELQPLGRRISQAFDFLWEAIPHDQVSDPAT